METRTRKVLKISRKRLGIVFAVLILIFIFIMLSGRSPRYMIQNTLSKMSGSDSALMPQSASMPSVYPGQYESSSVKDTREFMKVAYGADIKTRDVKEVMKDVKSAINDADGRIDNINESARYAYVNFVVPKTNFNDFKDAIEDITHEKLITENTSSQNLLGQKQSIEERTKTASDLLSELERKQKDLNAKHGATVNAIQKELTDTRAELILVRAEISSTSDSSKLATLRNRELNLSQREIQLQQNLNSENSIYAASSGSLKNQISDVNLELAGIKKEDVSFTDNIETVSGYVSVNWVNLWEMSRLLSPVHPAIIVIIVLLLAWYYLTRKNYLPHIELT